MAHARANGIELDFDTFGTSSGRPLLLIMGLGGQSIMWDEGFCDALAGRGHFVVRYDNRDVGLSTKFDAAGIPNVMELMLKSMAGQKLEVPYTLDDMADDAAGLLDALDVGRAHVVGVSMGGMIAQELALRHPTRVRGLVLACTYPEPDAEIERQREFSVGQFGGSVTTTGEMQVDVSAIDPLAFFQHLLPRVFNQSYIDQELPKLLQVFSGALQYGFSMEAILGQVAATMGHRTTDRLHHISAPTLVITGDADLLIPPANSDILAQNIPGAQLVKVPGGSHGFNFETPELFNRTVLEFLGGVGN